MLLLTLCSCSNSTSLIEEKLISDGYQIKITQNFVAISNGERVTDGELNKETIEFDMMYNESKAFVEFTEYKFLNEIKSGKDYKRVSYYPSSNTGSISMFPSKISISYDYSTKQITMYNDAKNSVYLDDRISLSLIDVDKAIFDEGVDDYNMFIKKYFNNIEIKDFYDYLLNK